MSNDNESYYSGLLDKQPAAEYDSELVEFPGVTEYTTEKCCCFRYYNITDTNEKYCGHWNISIWAPLGVTILILSSQFYFFAAIPKELNPIIKYISIIIMTIMCAIYLASYYLTIAHGPGYFPFYYSAYLKGTINNETYPDINGIEDCPAGYISNSQQHLYASVNPKPNRSILAKSARRIVIRPDHMCVWAATWIGKKNMKSFILFNIYGPIYCIIYMIMMDIFIFVDRSNYIVLGFNIAWSIAALCFGIWQITIAFRMIKDMVNGVTEWERWNRIDPEKFARSVKENIADVFGKPTSFLEYLIPSNPFSSDTNEMIVSNYANYYHN